MLTPEILTDEQLRAEHEAMFACEPCRTLQRTTNALHDTINAGLMLLSEWVTASQQLFHAEQRHRAGAHPRYQAHIAALMEKRGEAERV